MINAELYHRLQTVLRERDLREFPAPQRQGVFLLRLMIAVAEDVARGQLTLRAMSLVYTTLLSLVPLLAVSFSVLKAFGVHNQIEPALARFLTPLGPRGAEITEQIVTFVENIRVGVLGAVGMALLLYTVVALMQKIEQAFNAAWRVQRPRPFTQRFSDYLSVLLVGPVLVFSALGITASFFSADWVQRLAAIQPFGVVLDAVAALLPYLLIIAAFAFIYLFVPNTRVRPTAALVGALVAGVLWQSTGWLFASFVAGSTRYTAIYSAFAALVIFMIWLYLSWLILLMGASIAYYYQYPRQMLLHGEPAPLSPRLRERIALAIMARVATAFYARAPAPGAEALAEALRVPMHAVGEGLDALVSTGMLCPLEDPHGHTAYLPGTPPERTTLAEVLAAVRRHGERPGLDLHMLRIPAAAQRAAEAWDASLEDTLSGVTVRDLTREDMA
ncbi:YihY/virulence factor BrkB family protein [Arhodomonas aquaeolei]|uniref:YihY/virulence factor BrkB family protein n=1 Tax=Arhodomonas aquaeolei TaxID=2369 RepID=UPI00037D5D08|nr:YihY/virulence factor BrkB family protein [Arhodomonas aquaeolei]